jgi:transposase
MPKGVSSKVVFKPYIQNQLQVLPPSLEDLIPANHVVRVVNEAVDRMKVDGLLAKYDGGGASSYHPKMLLKVFLYGYLEGIYSSRRLAKALRENTHYMWLSGSQRPDFRTLNRFRSSRLKGTMDEIFVSLVELLVESDLVALKESFVDGTKIEAQANRYTFVWGKSTQKHKARLEQKVRDLLHQIDAENDAENDRYGDRDLEELGEDVEPITSEQLDRKLRELEERLRQKQDAPKAERRTLTKAVKQITKDFLPRLQKYERQQEILGERNSYSKTDPDATFMRMKEDHMRNGQLKPGYNVQISTEQQFITNVTVHQDRTDTATLPEHLDHFRVLHGRDPEVVVADAGYGSEENYQELEARGCEAYVKYNTFDQEQVKRRKRKKPGAQDFGYDIERDEYLCPQGRVLSHLRTRTRRTKNGYRTLEQIYEAHDCDGCPLKEVCCPKYPRRRLYVRPILERHKQEAREHLTSPEGLRYRKRRMIEPESVFAQIKHNRRFRRFHLRGLEKVEIEFGLVAMAHNIAKWCAKLDFKPSFSTTFSLAIAA